MSITSRITIAGRDRLIAAVAMTGCAGPGSTAPERSAPDAVVGTDSAATPYADADADGRRRDAGEPHLRGRRRALHDHAAGVQPPGLRPRRLEADRRGPATGSREYTNSDGSVATIMQQRITDLDPSIGDRAATEQLFTAAGLPAEQLEEQLLPTMTDGTAQFLSIAGHNSDGSWSATVARAFAKPGAALIVKVKTSSQESLRPDLHDILVHAQVVIV